MGKFYHVTLCRLCVLAHRAAPETLLASMYLDSTLKSEDPLATASFCRAGGIPNLITTSLLVYRLFICRLLTFRFTPQCTPDTPHVAVTSSAFLESTPWRL